MTYSIKEIYLTIQGEGFHAGKTSIFCSFSGCNLWTGLEKDRANAICDFCDTDFRGVDGLNGGKYQAEQLTQKILSIWPHTTVPVFLVCTGGEPLLQLNAELLDAFHQAGIYVAVETNGTVPLPGDIDWVCVSPKVGSELVVHEGDELKLVYPQKNVDPKSFESLNFDIFSLQPMDSEHRANHIDACVEYCRQNPTWRLSLQLHKFIGIP